MLPKKTVRVAAREAMQKFNYDPIDVLVQIAQKDDTNQATKIEVAQTLLPYMYPKLSNVTLDVDSTAGERGESQAILLQRLLSNPELADAAQRLSIAAAEAALEDMGSSDGMIN